MLTRLRTIAAAGAWAFLTAGSIGLLEAAARAFVLASPGSSSLSQGLATLLPAFTLYGWLGLVIAVLVSLPLLTLASRRRKGDPAAPALSARVRTVPVRAVGAALGVLGALYLAYFLRETIVLDWYNRWLTPPWRPAGLLALGVVVGLSLPLRRLTPLVGGGGRVRLAIMIVIAIAASWLWPDYRTTTRLRQLRGAEIGTAPPGAPNVLLLSIDALRHDKLSCLAPGAPPTPHLDRLAADSWLWTNAWAVSGWTVPSMSTVLTGRPPRTLGVGKLVGLPERVPTLAELARQAGWWTAGIVANPFLSEDFGFARGFADFDHSDVFEVLDPARQTILARELTRYIVEQTDLTDGRLMIGRAKRWLQSYAKPHPFLLWLHLMEPHLPYRSHPDALGRRPQLPEHSLLARDRFFDLHGLRAALPDVPPEIARAVEDLYDGEVAYADACVGELLAALAATGRAQNTWIVVFADHGEEFFEHGGFEHGHSLLPEVTRIPLLIRPPGGLAAGVRDDRAVSLLDLLPSLCQALAWPAPAGVPGRPALAPSGDGDQVDPTEINILENMLYGPPQHATLRWPVFAVADSSFREIVWYDLAADPGALRPVAAPADADVLQDAVRELVSEWNRLAVELGAGNRPSTKISPATGRRLRSLGY